LKGFAFHHPRFLGRTFASIVTQGFYRGAQDYGHQQDPGRRSPTCGYEWQTHSITNSALTLVVCCVYLRVTYSITLDLAESESGAADH
jgi:hypothetical protein